MRLGRSTFTAIGLFNDTYHVGSFAELPTLGVPRPLDRGLQPLSNHINLLIRKSVVRLQDACVTLLIKRERVSRCVSVIAPDVGSFVASPPPDCHALLCDVGQECLAAWLTCYYSPVSKTWREGHASNRSISSAASPQTIDQYSFISSNIIIPCYLVILPPKTKHKTDFIPCYLPRWAANPKNYTLFIANSQPLSPKLTTGRDNEV